MNKNIEKNKKDKISNEKEEDHEEELVNDVKVKGLISAEIKLNCYNIKKFEVPAAFLFVSPFTAANNMVTPKVRLTLVVSFDALICLEKF